MPTTTLKQNPNRAIVVGVGLKTESMQEIKESLAELEELTYSAGGVVVACLTQVLEKFIPATLLGSGKVQEIKQISEEQSADLVVIDHQLSGVQTRNLEQELGIRVLDRSQLILDIFALRAQTYEGKLQVELAQLLDQKPRMVGGWLGSLSRLGGGIGTRGPGETALEIDRRTIRTRIDTIKKKLEQVKSHRRQQRQQRQKSQHPSFALIGYTNAGKSTILNALAHADVTVKDQVFATLDPTTRKVFLDEMGLATLTDTVGFIRKLPTHLIESFKATLEESGTADILLFVIDLSNPQMNQHMQVVESLIEEFGWGQKPIIYVFNKFDVAPPQKQFQVNKYPRVFVSAKTGENLDKLKLQMIDQVNQLKEEVNLFFNKTEEFRIFDLTREAPILYKETGSTGTLCRVKLTKQQLSEWKNYLQN